VHFILKVAVKVLAAQLRRLRLDLFRILIIRWLVWINLFDFKIRYVSGSKYIIIDDLFRKSRILFDDIDE